jgi:hypothetical protein
MRCLLHVAEHGSHARPCLRPLRCLGWTSSRSPAERQAQGLGQSLRSNRTGRRDSSAAGSVYGPFSVCCLPLQRAAVRWTHHAERALLRLQTAHRSWHMAQLGRCAPSLSLSCRPSGRADPAHRLQRRRGCWSEPRIRMGRWNRIGSLTEQSRVGSRLFREGFHSATPPRPGFQEIVQGSAMRSPPCPSQHGGGTAASHVPRGRGQPCEQCRAAFAGENTGGNDG